MLRSKRKIILAINALEHLTQRIDSKETHLGDTDAHLGAFTLTVHSVLTSHVIWLPRPQWIRNNVLRKDRVLGEESVLATIRKTDGQLAAREQSNSSAV